jgi:hypothetical protein
LAFVQWDPELFLDSEGFAVFAPIYLVAQGVERLLEPIASLYKTTDDEKVAVKEAVEGKLRAEQAARVAIAAAPEAVIGQPALTPPAVAAAVDVASNKEREALDALEKKRRERAIIWWLVASVVSLAVCGALGLGILEAMSTKPLKEYLGAIDVAITGIAIGAGTKPLHDLLTRLEKAKENSDPATTPTEPMSGTAGAPASTPPPA